MPWVYPHMKASFRQEEWHMNCGPWSTANAKWIGVGAPVTGFVLNYLKLTTVFYVKYECLCPTLETLSHT